MADQIDAAPPATPAGPPGAPRWAKLAGVIAAVIVVLVVAMLVTGGDHSPSRHLVGGSAPADHTPPPGVTHGEQP